jgi:hypothetical protein
MYAIRTMRSRRHFHATARTTNVDFLWNLVNLVNLVSSSSLECLSSRHPRRFRAGTTEFITVLDGLFEDSDFNIHCPNPICRIYCVTLSADDPEFRPPRSQVNSLEQVRRFERR